MQDAKFYLVGTTQKLPPSWLSKGVNLYSSLDLENWSFEGEIFSAAQVHGYAQGPLRLERPKLLHNALTQKYVLWFHLDDVRFQLGMVGVATSPTVNGTYEFASGWRPDGQRSLDMTIFSPQGEAAAESVSSHALTSAPPTYLARSVDNAYSGFSRLTDDYLNTTASGIVSRGPRCEGMALWSEAGGIDMLCSHLTGWHANPALLARTSQSRLEGATWRVLGNPTSKPYSLSVPHVLNAPIPRATVLVAACISLMTLILLDACRV